MEQIALTIHITTATALIGLVVATDLYGLLWVIGRRTTLSRRTLTVLHRLVWTGLTVMIASGGVMFLTYREYLLTVPAFFVKMGFVAALLINAVVIGRHLHLAAERPFAEVSRRERRSLYISGVVSTGSWVGAILAARMLGL